LHLVISGISLLLAACQVPPGASRAGIGESDLAGRVTSANGPEAGVWVIAETTDLPTKFTKIVVTDDRGRYLIPELPKANYSVWVRGYGLIDSPKVQAAPGKILDLNAVVATSATAAAEYYPAIYWYSMLKVPERNEFPLGKAANQGQWLDLTKTDGCYTCHQLGNKATRAIPKERGHFNSSVGAWARRIDSGPGPGAACGERNKSAGPRSENAFDKEQPDGALSLLGSRADLGQPDKPAQPDVRREGQGLVHLARARAGEPGLLRKRVGSSFGKDLSRRTLQPPALHVRSEDREVHAHR